MTLVVLTAFGPEYREMARLCVRSLRHRGGYRGDVIALSDGAIPGATTVTMTPTGPEVMTARLQIPELIDLTGYRRLWYLDCDIRVVAPWYRLATLAYDDLGAITDACTTLVESPFTSQCLTPAELARWGRQPAVNSGVVGINLRHHEWPRLWAEWRRLVAERLAVTNAVDESPANALALRYRLRRIGNSLVHWPANPHSTPAHPVLIHYAGLSLTERLTAMRGL